MGRCGENFKFVLDENFAFAGYSNRFGGVSKDDFDSLNLGLHVGDDGDLVIKNREILKQNLDLKSLIFMEQIHGDGVEILIDENQSLPPCDAVITNLKNIALAVMVADCVGVMLVSKECVGVVHAGRAGILKKLTSKTINLMKKEFNAKNINLFTTPFIQGSCYDIGNLNLKDFNKFINKSKFNMQKALFDEVRTLNLERCEVSKICTHCDKNFFSYRREKITGRFAGICALK
ncbi:laccase domain-containing protein [Campylobacter sp. FMV-PI01]|uniref:Laccase domain-containing protein n=1 Tax=Campylobacter portucalensis TaxID=2608384 RepID=A0A6L5WHI6_9BACT|nr:polyphenol oxidase family protein [Campylobacter portucalensis]MSN96356.1 laccase domain-containing protein [Campylobacter portucalensis]